MSVGTVVRLISDDGGLTMVPAGDTETGVVADGEAGVLVHPATTIAPQRRAIIIIVNLDCIAESKSQSYIMLVLVPVVR